jgi:hypothetical protein
MKDIAVFPYQKNIGVDDLLLVRVKNVIRLRFFFTGKIPVTFDKLKLC